MLIYIDTRLYFINASNVNLLSLVMLLRANRLLAYLLVCFIVFIPCAIYAGNGGVSVLIKPEPTFVKIGDDLGGSNIKRYLLVPNLQERRFNVTVLRRKAHVCNGIFDHELLFVEGTGERDHKGRLINYEVYADDKGGGAKIVKMSLSQFIANGIPDDNLRVVGGFKASSLEERYAIRRFLSAKGGDKFKFNILFNNCRDVKFYFKDYINEMHQKLKMRHTRKGRKKIELDTKQQNSLLESLLKGQ